MNKNVYFASVLVISQVYGGAAAGGGDEAAKVIKAIGSLFGKGGEDGAAGAPGSSGSGVMNFGGGAAAGAAQGAGGISGLPGGLPTPPAGASVVYNITNNSADNRQTVNVGPDGKPMVPGQPLVGADGQALKDSTGAPMLAPQPAPQPGQPMKDAGDRPIIDPTTNQPVLVPAAGFAPGAIITAANGQPIINAQTGQPYTAPQAIQPGAPLVDSLGKPVIDSQGKPVVMPAATVANRGGVANAAGFSGVATAGAPVGVALDDSILKDPTKDPLAYNNLINAAMAEPEAAKALRIIREQVPEEYAAGAREPILRPFLNNQNTAVAKAAEVEQLRQEAMKASAEREAREQAEAIRKEQIKKEIDNLNQANQKIIKYLMSEGVSSAEIAAIMANARETGNYDIDSNTIAQSAPSVLERNASAASVLERNASAASPGGTTAGASGLTSSVGETPINVDKSKVGNVKGLLPPPVLTF